MEESIWEKPEVSHKNFVRLYRSKKINAYIHRSNALRVISEGWLPKRYFWIHTIWSWIWFVSIPAGIIMLFFNVYIGLTILFFISLLVGMSVNRAAGGFVLKYALENEEFYKKIIQGKVLIIEYIKPIKEKIL